MGRLYQERLDAGGGRVYCCSSCRAQLALRGQIVSKQFQGRHGRAYLFETAVNVVLGPKEDRILMTGLHTVADLFCAVCQQPVGWKYIEAHEPSQKYKENKVILEKAKLVKSGGESGEGLGPQDESME